MSFFIGSPDWRSVNEGFVAVSHRVQYLVWKEEKSLIITHHRGEMSIIFSVSERRYLYFVLCRCWLALLLLSWCSKELCKEWRPCVVFFHLGMNSISPGARFTEPTRENKDALIRNIRGEKNHCCCEWAEWMPVGGVHVFIKPQWWKKGFVPHSSEKIVFIFWLITHVHRPNISLSSKRYRYLTVFEANVLDITSTHIIHDSFCGKFFDGPFLWCLKKISFLLLNDKTLK